MNVREYIKSKASDARDAILVLQDQNIALRNDKVAQVGLNRLQQLINAIEHMKDPNEDIYSLLDRATSKD